jgi:hypothetical protein
MKHRQPGGMQRMNTSTDTLTRTATEPVRQPATPPGATGLLAIIPLREFFPQPVVAAVTTFNDSLAQLDSQRVKHLEKDDAALAALLQGAGDEAKHVKDGDTARMSLLKCDSRELALVREKKEIVENQVRPTIRGQIEETKDRIAERKEEIEDGLDRMKATSRWRNGMLTDDKTLKALNAQLSGFREQLKQPALTEKDLKRIAELKARIISTWH